MKGTTLEIGGKTRRLRYDLNAIAELGERLKITIRLDKVKEDLLDVPLPLSALRTILWAGLIHEEPTLDPVTVGSWVDTENMPDVLLGFFALFGAHLPGKEDRERVAETLGIQVPEFAEPEPANVG